MSQEEEEERKKKEEDTSLIALKGGTRYKSVLQYKHIFNAGVRVMEPFLHISQPNLPEVGNFCTLHSTLRWGEGLPSGILLGF